jgi:kynurenine formamidase
MGNEGSVKAESRYIDLTHSFDEKTIYWPTGIPFQLEEVHKGMTSKGFWYESNNIRAAEHGGTHLDAPAHFAKGKWHVEDIPLNHLIGPGILIDVTDNSLGDPDYQVTRNDLLKWEKTHGRIPTESIVLIMTGWEKFWSNKKNYLGTDQPGDTQNLHFPGLSQEAALFLAKERNIFAFGLDTASLDPGQSKNFPAHQVFGEANIPGFENLSNLDQLPPKGFRVIALPMKIGGGSGAPLRIIAEIQ